MVRLTIGAGLLALLAGCGGGAPQQSTTVTPGADGSVTVAGSNASVTVNATECKKPDYAPTYADAKITTCVGDEQDARESRGSVMYTSAAAPAAVLAWSKEQAVKSGLEVSLQNDMSVSASDGDRTLMVMAMPQGSGSQVSVNWGDKR